MTIVLLIKYKQHTIQNVVRTAEGAISSLLFSCQPAPPTVVQQACSAAALAAAQAAHISMQVTLSVRRIIYTADYAIQHARSVYDSRAFIAIENAVSIAHAASYAARYAAQQAEDVLIAIMKINTEKIPPPSEVEWHNMGENPVTTPTTTTTTPSSAASSFVSVTSVDVSPVVSSPLITIIMATYNCAKYVEHAILSIQRQNIPNWEFIIIDDSSTDNSDYLLRACAQKDRRIVYFRNEENVGCYVSKNIGILHARGMWLTFQDADDYSFASRLKLQLDACTVHGFDCSYVKFLSRKVLTWSWAPISLFIRRDVFQDMFGFFDSVRAGADSELHSRITHAKLKIHITHAYQYACLDQWLEFDTPHARQSLTQDTNYDPVRILYKNLFSQYHPHNTWKYNFLNGLHHAIPEEHHPLFYPNQTMMTHLLHEHMMLLQTE
jgi:hypothetical protein